MSFKHLIEYLAKHWITAIPAIVILWPSIVALVINIEVVVSTFKFLVNEQFGSGMTGYEIMEMMVNRYAIEEGLVE